MNIEPLKEEIIDMYVNKLMDTVQISQKLGCSSSGVGRLLNRNGIVPRHRPNDLRLSDLDIQNICELYNNNNTTEKIGSMYGISGNSVSKVLKENGVKIKRAARYSKVASHNYFESIDTKEKAYFLGWMITDGSVVVSKTRPDRSPIISLEISGNDRYVLEKFAEELCAEEDIVKSFDKRGHTYIRFASNKMAHDLEKYGVVPNKTWITYLPEIRADLMPHLIRGIFDGNGTVTIDSHCVARFAFYGSEKLCIGVRDFLHNNIGVNQNKVSKSTCYHVWWGGKTPSKLFYDYIYNDCEDIFLTRKKDKFDRVIQH